MEWIVNEIWMTCRHAWVGLVHHPRHLVSYPYPLESHPTLSLPEDYPPLAPKDNYRNCFFMETNLPQEIADIIIDEVSKEPEPVLRATTLRACSLVSNIWVYRSQQHLFSKVAFDKVGFQKWRAKIKPRKDGPPHHVTHLHLTQEHGGSYLDGIVPDISHMTSFTNLRVLHVVNAPLQHEQVRLAYGTLGPTVSHLSLEGCLMDIYHLACFLRFFTNLEDLSILDPRILPGPKPEYPPEPPNAKQKINLELRVDVAYSGWPFVYELSLLPVAVHAITLVEPNPPLVSRGYGAGHCMSEINKLLAASHETLTRFRVHTDHAWGVDLTNVDALEELEFNMEHIHQIAPTLQTVTSNRLAVIVLDTSDSHYNYPNTWKRLDDALYTLVDRIESARASRDDGSRLRVKLFLRSKAVESDVVGIAGQLLPKCVERGCVTVSRAVLGDLCADL